MFFSSLIEELFTKEENNKAGCTLTSGEQCIMYTFGNILAVFRFCEFCSYRNNVIDALKNSIAIQFHHKREGRFRSFKNTENKQCFHLKFFEKVENLLIGTKK